MIDYFLKFTSETAARTGLKSYNRNQSVDWEADDVMVRNVQVWRPSQDNPDGTHNYLSGYYLLVCLSDVDQTALGFTQVQVVIDRDLASAGQPGAVVKSNLTQAVLQDIMFSPVPAGANYPWGNFQ